MRHSGGMSTRALPRRRFENRDRRALERSGWRTVLEYTENQSRHADGKLARLGAKDLDRYISVTLLDEERNEVWRWHFRNAFPVGYHTTALDTVSAEPVAEILTLTFDSMEID